LKEIASIKTDRLLLRAIGESDLVNIYKGLSHSEVIKHYGISFETLEATKEQMNWFADSRQFW
jgi:ribosomal-protein-alanine N-acetyltransferase